MTTTPEGGDSMTRTPYRLQIPNAHGGGPYWRTVAAFCDFDWASAFAALQFPREPWRIVNEHSRILFDTRRDDRYREAERVGMRI